MGVSQDQTLIQSNAEVYGISSQDSNGMKSSNPNSGIYKADTARTLDLNGGNPACNQGGMAVVQKANEHKTYQKVTGTLNPGAHAGSYNGQDAYNDMLIVEPSNWDGSQVTPTLTARNAGGGQRMPDKENFNAVIVPMTENIPKCFGTEPTLICLNDQGGQQMNVSQNVSGTLRAQEHGHQPYICLEGNGSRDSHKGDGYKESDTMYTLNTVEQHGVCYGIDQQGGKGGANYTTDVAPTLAADSHGTPHGVCYGFEPGAAQRLNPEGRFTKEVSPTLRAKAGDNQASVAKCYGLDSYNQQAQEEKMDTLRTNGGGDNSPKVRVAFQGKAGAEASLQLGNNVSPTLSCTKEADVCYGLDRASFNQGKNAKYGFAVEEETAQPLVARGPGGVCTKQ